MKKTIKIAIADDHVLFRKGLISLLKEYESFNVSFEASNGSELLEKLKSKKADVILLDLEMPDMNGFETVPALTKKHPDIKIIALTMHSENGIVHHLLNDGIHGFLSKNCSIDSIAEAIHSVVETGYYFNDHVSKEMIKDLISAKKMKPNLKRVTLSEREIEVIKLICKEYTNKEIADKLFISVRTVDNHRENILRKINAKNIIGVVMYAIRNKIVEK